MTDTQMGNEWTLSPQSLALRLKCPNCGSSNVAVGNVVLSCADCDWSFLNKHPCDVCGKPSYSSIGASNGATSQVNYRCREHAMSKEESRAVLRSWLTEVRLRTRPLSPDFVAALTHPDVDDLGGFIVPPEFTAALMEEKLDRWRRGQITTDELRASEGLGPLNG